MFGVEEIQVSLNRAKETLSLSAFQTVVSHAFGGFSPAVHDEDSQGIDARCHFNLVVDKCPILAQFNVQVKGTSRDVGTIDHEGRKCWNFPVKEASLANYRIKTNCELVLVLVIFPSETDYEGWLKIQENSSTLLNEIYWVPISQCGSAKTTVYVPIENRLNQESLLKQIVLPIARRIVAND